MRRYGNRATKRGGAARGFTLIELLVVLTIMGLAMVAVPSVLSALPAVRLRAAADRMAATLRELHGEAIRRQATTELLFDPAARTWRRSTDAAAHRLPEVVTGLALTTVVLRPDDRILRIRFFADGSASGGTIRLAHGRLSASITVDWLTGRVGRHG